MRKLAEPDGTRAPNRSQAGTTSSCVQTQHGGSLPPVQADKSLEAFTEFEGTTSFGRASAATHRYKLSLRSNKHRIWLGDCESKNQWCTSELALESYINPNNAVPYATASDYVENFHMLLSETVEDADEMPRAFQRTKGDAFRLEIDVKLQVLARTRVVTYSFDMEPILVERIDVLESKVRDHRDEVNVLKAGGNTRVMELEETVKKLQVEVSCRQAENADLQITMKDIENNPFTIQTEATKRTAGDALCWPAAWNYSNGSDGIIRNLQPGTYLVNAVINYQEGGYGKILQLMKGRQRVQLLYCNSTTSRYASAVLSCSMRVGEGDPLSVECTANQVTTSYMTLTRVGS